MRSSDQVSGRAADVSVRRVGFTPMDKSPRIQTNSRLFVYLAFRSIVRVEYRACKECGSLLPV